MLPSPLMTTERTLLVFRLCRESTKDLRSDTIYLLLSLVSSHVHYHRHIHTIRMYNTSFTVHLFYVERVSALELMSIPHSSNYIPALGALKNSDSSSPLYHILANVVLTATVTSSVPLLYRGIWRLLGRRLRSCRGRLTACARPI